METCPTAPEFSDFDSRRRRELLSQIEAGIGGSDRIGSERPAELKVLEKDVDAKKR